MVIPRAFTVLMLVNAALTGAAAVLLTVSPSAIPGTVGFPAGTATYPMGYMLGAAEVGLAIMFFFGRKISDPFALRVILAAGAGFHVASAAAEAYAVMRDQAGNAVWLNIALRLVLAAMLLRFAIRPPAATKAISERAAADG